MVPRIRILLLLLAFSAGAMRPALGARCAADFAPLARATAHAAAGEVELASADFDALTSGLARTLSGNLATVLRSEWKAKGSVQEANAYVHDLSRSFLSPETSRAVNTGLDPAAEGYTRQLAQQLHRLEKTGRLRAGDRLFVRDPPAPPGASDTTFTYYSRAVRDPLGGKHQVRVRNYLRQLDLSALPQGQSVEGFAGDGALIRIERMDERSFRMARKAAAEESSEILASSQIEARLGKPPFLFAAPHGRSFKLEVKSRLKDTISGETFPKLGGNNLVQKLDVGLSSAQLQKLFGESPLPPPARIAAVKAELLASGTAEPGRVNAVFAVLEKGAAADPGFLRLEGATRYGRNAFEIAVPDKVAGKPVRLQTTVDRDLAVHRDLYDASGRLMSPGEAVALTDALPPADTGEQRHWELKVPRPLVARAVGVQSHPADAGAMMLEVDDLPPSEETVAVLRRFSLCPVTNRGKFLHICEQRPMDDRK